MIANGHLGPPIVARALAVVHTCMYDAWAAYDDAAVGTHLGSALRRPTSEHTQANKEKAISYAAYRALVDLYPDQVAYFNTLMNHLGYNPSDASTDSSIPTGVGNAAAQAVLDFRHNDGSNQPGNLHPGAYSDYTGYAPKNTPDHIADPNAWQPLRVSTSRGIYVTQQYVTAFCGLMKPFALSSGSQFRPSAPAVYPSQEYTLQAQQILDYSANLTDEHKVIVEYWADGPGTVQPPGHWNLFAQYVSQRDKLDLDAQVKLFFMLTNAVFDAGIAAWETKLFYNSERPITALHFLFAGKQVRAWGGPYQGAQVIEGQNWRPYQIATIVTPAFPEYLSGHSAFSASAAEILKRFTGSDTFGASQLIKAGTAPFEIGQVPATDITLSWTTFSNAANQAGMSRRYGGIHFEQGDLMGRAMGRQVAAVVWDKAQAYIHGNA
ncbi:MAG TPA: vanadium-dependent haloperoxidase [Ktedonobacteraceae bacterium]